MADHRPVLWPGAGVGISPLRPSHDAALPSQTSPQRTTKSASVGWHRRRRQPLWAGCTLGDIIAEFVVFGLGITIGGMALYPGAHR